MPGPVYAFGSLTAEWTSPSGVDHRRGLQVVGRDALALHVDDRPGDVVEAPPVEREGDVEPRDLPRERRVGRLDVGGTVAVGHVARVVAGRRRLDLGVGDRRQARAPRRRPAPRARARSRTRVTSASPTGSIPPSTCQSRWIVSHSSRSSAS